MSCRATVIATLVLTLPLAMSMMALPTAGYGERVFNANLATSNNNYDVDTSQQVAQSFTPLVSYILNNVTLYVENLGASQTDTLRVNIETDASGQPSGTVIVTGGASRSGLGWLNVFFSPNPTLAAGTVYWIVASNTEASGQGYQWFHSNGNTVPGEAMFKSGAVWNSIADRDMTYLTYGLRLEPRIIVEITVDKVNVDPGQTLKYALYLNNTGSLSPTTTWLNLTLPIEVRYIADTASSLGGVKTVDYNWTFSVLDNNPHFFTVTVSVNPLVKKGSLLTAVARLGHTDSSGNPLTPSSASASSLVGMRWKQMFLIHDGVKDDRDRLQASWPSGVVEDFDGDGFPGLTIESGSVIATAPRWTLYPPYARSFHLFGPTYAYLFMDSKTPLDTVTLNLTLFDRSSGVKRITSTLSTIRFNAMPDWEAFTIDFGFLDYVIAPGNVTELAVFNDAGDDVYIAYNSSTRPSMLIVTTETYVSIDFVSVEDANGPATFFSTMETVFIGALVSDPFGSEEIAGVWINITDPDDVQVVIVDAMTLMLTDPSFPSAWKIFLYPYANPLKEGTYNFTLIAVETNGVFDTYDGNFTVRVPVLSLDVEPDSGYVIAGSSTDLTVNFNNSGQGTATAWVNITLPVDFTYVSDTSALNGGVKTGNYNWTFASVAPGSHKFNITMTASPSVPPATILYIETNLTYADEKDFIWSPPPVNSSYTVGGPSFVAGLALNPTTVHRLEIVNMTLQFNNIGTEGTRTAWVNVTLPPSLTYLSDDASALPQYTSKNVAGNPLEFVFSNVDVGAHSFSILARGSTGILPFETIPVSTTVEYPVSATVLRSNATAEASGAGPWIAVNLIGPLVADPGDRLSLTLYYNNTGSEDARNVTLNLTLDPASNYSTASPPPTLVQSSFVRWFFSSVPVGQHSITLEVLVSSGLTDGSFMSFSGTPDYVDVVGNVFIGTPEIHSISITAPSFAFTVGANAVTVEGGDIVQFDLSYTNSGSGMAANVWVNVSLPTTLNFIDDDALVAETVAAGLRSWRFQNVAPGPHGFHINASIVYSAVHGEVLTTNTTFYATDANGGFVSTSARDVLLTVSTSRVMVALNSVPAQAQMSQTFSYNIVVNNTGGRTAAFVWLNQTLDSRFQLVADTSNLPRSQQGNTITWQITSLASFQSRSFEVTVRVTGGARGDLVSLGAEVDYTGAQGVPIGFHRAPDFAVELLLPPATQDDFLWILVGAVTAIVVSLLLFFAWRLRRAKIEEVFLLHSEGTLLYHVSRSLGGVGEKDKDLLAGMLTAIQDFVKESFAYGEKQELNQLDFGDYSVILERGNHIFIAVVYSGKGESEVKRVTRRAVEEVEEKFGKDLEDWGGHMNRIMGARDIVRGLLKKY